MDVEELINKKKEELVAEVKKEAKDLEERFGADAVEKLTKFVAEVKMATNVSISNMELLHVIERNGLVYQRVFDVMSDTRFSSIRKPAFIREIAEIMDRERVSYGDLTGKQQVTIIIEPIEE